MKTPGAMLSVRFPDYNIYVPDLPLLRALMQASKQDITPIVIMQSKYRSSSIPQTSTAYWNSTKCQICLRTTSIHRIGWLKVQPWLREEIGRSKPCDQKLCSVDLLVNIVQWYLSGTYSESERVKIVWGNDNREEGVGEQPTGDEEGSERFVRILQTFWFYFDRWFVFL